MRKENVLRRLLNEGKPSLGTHVRTPWPGMFEVIGNSGVFDYIEYVSDIPPGRCLYCEIVRTMETLPANVSDDKNRRAGQSMVATRAIDAGFQSVIFGRYPHGR